MNIIAVNRMSKVVEFNVDGVLKRRVLPIDSETIELGVPYGLPFAAILKKSIGDDLAIQIENALHNSGVWDTEDLQTNPMVAINIANKLNVDAKKILNLIKQYGGNNG